LPELRDRLFSLRKTLKSRFSLRSESIEFLFVNDGSKDGSYAFLRALSTQEKGFRLVNLSRNHGHQLAITAGLDLSRGEAVVVMDGDLQDPPEFIPELYAKFQEGFDVVYAKRAKRSGESWFKLVTARVFYRVMKNMTKFDIPLDTGDFRIMSRRVVQILCSLRETHRYIRGLISWIGFQQTGLEYEREQRKAGVTKFSLAKMLKFALDGITSFSAVPLKFASYLGISTSFLGILYAIHALYLKFFTDRTIQGWTSLVIIVLVLGGIQLISLGMIGEYISRIHDESKNRPLYVIEGIYEK